MERSSVYCWVYYLFLVLQVVPCRSDLFPISPAEEAREEIVAFQKRWEASQEEFPRIHINGNQWARLNSVDVWLGESVQTETGEGNVTLGEELITVSPGDPESKPDEPMRPILLQRPIKDRKEVRLLNPVEWGRFKRAVLAMKETMIDGVSEFLLFAMMHRYSMSPAAHRGAAFLPWHREYLFRFERALQMYDPEVFLPYWDSSLDQGLPEPRDSVLFTPELLGNAEGIVTEGPFAYWTVFEGCEREESDDLLYRDAKEAPVASWLLYSDSSLSSLLDHSYYRDISDQDQPNFESVHAGSHRFVGGHLGDIICSTNDPLFWMLHAFVDCSWEEFRRHQVSQPEKEYPSTREVDIGGTLHDAYAYMKPFDPLRNIHGLSNHYTNYYYHCAPRVRHCDSQEDCGSIYLWCDFDEHRCRSKVRQGGICTGLPAEACFSDRRAGFCRGGRCTEIV